MDFWLTCRTFPGLQDARSSFWEVDLEPATLAIEHLLLRLRGLNRALHAAVEAQQTAAERFARPGLASLCITDKHVHALLDDVDALVTHGNSETTATTDL